MRRCCLGSWIQPTSFMFQAESPNSARRTWGGGSSRTSGCSRRRAGGRRRPRGGRVRWDRGAWLWCWPRRWPRGPGRERRGGEFAGFRWTATEVTDRDPTPDWENSVQIGAYAEHGVRLYKVVVTTRNADGREGCGGGSGCGWGPAVDDGGDRAGGADGGGGSGAGAVVGHSARPSFKIQRKVDKWALEQIRLIGEAAGDTTLSEQAARLKRAQRAEGLGIGKVGRRAASSRSWRCRGCC